MILLFPRPPPSFGPGHSTQIDCNSYAFLCGSTRDRMAAEDELSPASTPSSGGPEQHEGEPGPARPPPRKRRRLIISCTECHRRKQKCDRGLPCANCVSRNKQDSCRYEAGAPTAKGLQNAQGDDHSARGGSHLVDPRFKVEGTAGPGMSDKLTNFGYSTTGSSSSTLGFLSKIDGNNADESSLSSMAMGRESSGEHFGMRERYKSLIRQLPARSYTEKLVDMYFKDFNWQYNVSLCATVAVTQAMLNHFRELISGCSTNKWLNGIACPSVS